MVHGQVTTQKERELITARLFRQDSAKEIAYDMNVSERSIRRMSKSLRDFGTPVPPKESKPRGRHQLLSADEHEVLQAAAFKIFSLTNYQALARFVADFPIALRSDMTRFVRDTFGKSVTEATVGRAIKRMGFTQILIARGSRAIRTDLPPQAADVRQVAEHLIAGQYVPQMIPRGDDSHVDPVASRRGTCAWVRLAPGSDTGFNPRINKRKISDQDSLHQDPLAIAQTTNWAGNLPAEQYVSPYT